MAVNLFLGRVELLGEGDAEFIELVEGGGVPYREAAVGLRGTRVASNLFGVLGWLFGENDSEIFACDERSELQQKGRSCC